MPTVLLVSPVQGLDPPNGDVTYTNGLLQCPPTDVRYVTYAEALASGRLQELRRPSRDRRGKARLLLSPPTTREAVINRLRRHELLFREPFRFFQVKPNAFDLIHCHAFSIRFVGDDETPVVFSNAAASEWLYRDGEHWSEIRVAWARRADQTLAAALDVQHAAYRLHGVARVASFSEYLRDWYIATGAAPPDRIDVVPAGINVPGEPRAMSDKPRRLLFVGNFEIKGGDLALAAYEIVRRRHPDVELTIVGSPPRIARPEADARGIEWLDRLPRQELLTRIVPRADVFLYPTRFDGFPLTLLEVMACGVPVAATDYRAIPEMLGYGEAGLLSPTDNAAALAENVLRLLDPSTNRRFGIAATERVVGHYSKPIARRKLADCYAAALAS